MGLLEPICHTRDVVPPTCDTRAFSEVEMGDGRAVCQQAEQALVLQALTLGHIEVGERQARGTSSSHCAVHGGHHRAAW